MRRRIARALRVTVAVATAFPSLGHSAPNLPDLGPAPSAPAPYEDRLIDNGKLAPQTADQDEVPYNSGGWARTWRVEGFGSRIEQGGSVEHENGVVLNGSIDTPEYGSLSFDGSARGRSSGVFTIWQRGLAFDDGWRANNAAGMLNTPGIELSRQQYRFFMPTFPVAGAQTEWLQRGDVQVQASVGEPGTYDGVRLAGFSRLGGTLATVGAQWNDPHWQGGFQAVDLTGVRAGLDVDDPNARSNGRSVYGALAWSEPGTHLQFNLIDSELGDTRHSLGAWAEGETAAGRYRHNYGVFRFDPELAWGYSPINRDLQGFYYRVSYASQQVLWSGGLDKVASVSGNSPDTLYGTGSLRYQLDHKLGIGGGTTLRRSEGSDAQSGYVFMDKLSVYGTTRVQVDTLHTEQGDRGTQVTVDQSWPTQVGLRLSTTLSLGTEKTATAPRLRRASGAVLGSYDITGSLSIEGSLRLSEDRDQTTRSIGRYANVGLLWKMSPRWSLIASYYDNRSTVSDFDLVAIDPAVPPPVATPVARDRAVFLTLRYEDHAGTPSGPLGGAPGAGAGTLSGSVYYDANDDGLRGASEKGAVNVTVVLDGRFGTRTDNDGRFTFPMVAAGPHVVSVVPDNLALSYNIAGDNRRPVVVRTRDTTTIDIAATRVR